MPMLIGGETDTLDDTNKNSDMLLKIIKIEKERLPGKSNKGILLGGFQQGCMVALAAFIKLRD